MAQSSSIDRVLLWLLDTMVSIQESQVASLDAVQEVLRAMQNSHECYLTMDELHASLGTQKAMLSALHGELGRVRAYLEQQST